MHGGNTRVYLEHRKYMHEIFVENPGIAVGDSLGRWVNDAPRSAPGSCYSVFKSEWDRGWQDLKQPSIAVCGAPHITTDTKIH